MKTDFTLDMGNGDEKAGHSMTAKIIGRLPKDLPYLVIYTTVSVGATQAQAWIRDEDLERFAVNILTAIKSKRLKPKTR